MPYRSTCRVYDGEVIMDGSYHAERRKAKMRSERLDENTCIDEMGWRRESEETDDDDNERSRTSAACVCTYVCYAYTKLQHPQYDAVRCASDELA